MKLFKEDTQKLDANAHPVSLWCVVCHKPEELAEKHESIAFFIRNGNSVCERHFNTKHA